MELLAIYLGLFGASFLAATLIPAQSEAVLFGLLMTGSYPTWLLLAVASTGNVLGSCVNWLLGAGVSRFEGRRGFPVKRENLMKAEGWYHRYGRWSLLLSWVPIIGDPLTVVAGVLREPFFVFLVLVTVAKVGRGHATRRTTFRAYPSDAKENTRFRRTREPATATHAP